MNPIEQLFALALQSRSNAYSPYSGFAVGAALITPGQKFYSGCNVENISYPCGSCAEQSAIAAMVGEGERQISQILIVADTLNPITPCGACLQRIKEFSNHETIVHLANLDGVQTSCKLDQLLPFAFAAQEVKKCTNK